MSEITLLRETLDALASRSPSPHFGELKHRATRRGRRRVIMLAAAGAVAFIAVGGGIAGSLEDSDQVSLIGDPPARESAEPLDSSEAFSLALVAIVEDVPGWAVNPDLPYDYEYAFNGPCSLNWQPNVIGGGDSKTAGLGHAVFPTSSSASDAAARLVEKLESCTVTEWRTQPIARTRAVLASSAGAVIWIQPTGDMAGVYQVPTTDGPPPVSVQVEVAEWMADYHTWMKQIYCQRWGSHAPSCPGS